MWLKWFPPIENASPSPYFFELRLDPVAWADIGDPAQLLEADNRLRRVQGLPERAEYAQATGTLAATLQSAGYRGAVAAPVLVGDRATGAITQAAAGWLARRDRGLLAWEQIELEHWKAADPRREFPAARGVCAPVIDCLMCRPLPIGHSPRVETAFF